MASVETPHTISEKTDHLQGRLTELLTPLHFKDLLETASHVCLSRPLPQVESAPLEGEAKIIAHIGVRGVRAALELSENIIYDAEDKPEGVDVDQLLTADTPIRFPEAFGGPVDPDILTQATVFGEQLIKESFSVLGRDAYKKLEQYKAATTSDQQMEVIDWLNERLTKLATKKLPIAEPDQQNDSFYHPIRLSPKMIGTYEQQNLNPTCLSVSIIAASFFTRAGADILHADVVRSSPEGESFYAVDFIKKVFDAIPEKTGLTTPQAVSGALIRTAAQTVEYLTREEANHACIYVKLLDDNWAQVDSNYQSTHEIKTPHSKETLDTSLEILRSANQIAPGIEVSNVLYDEFYNAQLTTELLDLRTPEDTIELIARADDAFSVDTADAFAQSVYENCIYPYICKADDNSTQQSMNMILKEDAIQHYHGYEEAVIENLYHKLFEKYVLWGQSPIDVFERAQTDMNYRLNRVQDIALLPFMVLTAYAREGTLWNTGRTHMFVELGMPATRIGLAVLSDFAHSTDSPLPPSFWLSHWPSHVATVANIDTDPATKYEDQILYNNLGHRSIHPLTSKRNNSIVKQFLDSRTPTEATEEHNGQEEAGPEDAR